MLGLENNHLDDALFFANGVIQRLTGLTILRIGGNRGELYDVTHPLSGVKVAGEVPCVCVCVSAGRTRVGSCCRVPGARAAASRPCLRLCFRPSLRPCLRPCLCPSLRPSLRPSVGLGERGAGGLSPLRLLRSGVSAVTITTVRAPLVWLGDRPWGSSR